MSITIEIPDDIGERYSINGECDYHDCEGESGGFYYGYSIEKDDTLSVFVAEYCEDHQKTHAEPSKGMWYLGDVER